MLQNVLVVNNSKNHVFLSKLQCYLKYFVSKLSERSMSLIECNGGHGSHGKLRAPKM